MIVTIKNNRDTTQNIEFHVDDRVEITTSIEPSASVEREYELSPGQHSFILFHEVNGTLELYQARNLKIESDDSLFFELE